MTQSIPVETASELRHEFRTPVNHILGYAEMLREDAEEGSPDSALLDRIVAASREALDSINAALPSTGESSHDAIAALQASLRGPATKVEEATTALLSRERDAQFVTDVERIADAARRLATVATALHSGGVGGAVRANVTTGEFAVRYTPSLGISAVPARPAPDAPPRGRILIVDDVQENREVLARRLSREGYETESAASGAEAIARVAEGGFDLVLLDVIMPGMDGFAVLERIKADQATRSVPVIMISALDDLSSVVRCIEHGAEDYLAKPFDPVLLRARIGASLEKKRWYDREADYLRQVARVIDAAGAVERGTYAPGTLGTLTGRDDELGRLARVFDAMAAGIRARESRLREQLRELQADVTLATNEHHVADMSSGDDTLRVGDTLAARYEILGLIGRGGMGVVYLAHDRELQEDVAVKTIPRALLSGDEVLSERFRSEIRLARRISHRNVVRTHDLGEADGTWFVTMEYVRGISVRELLKTRGQLSVASALALARQFADALAVAHAAGVIHRDVKPENAMIDADGVLKVMDFGIARLAEATSTRTQTGMVVGTPGYMAPEQLVGDELDARADLYSLGVVMYECLTGRQPFEASSMVALIGKVLTSDAAPPMTLNEEISPALSALVLRLLSKTPAERPESATVLQEMLAELG